MIGRLTIALAIVLAPLAAGAGDHPAGADAAAAPRGESEVVPASGVPAAVVEALAVASAAPGSRVEIRGYRATLPDGCTPNRAEASRPVDQSGRQAIELFGSDAGGFACQGWAFVDLKLTADAYVTTRVVKAGEPLEDAVRVARREIKPGSRPLHLLPEGARASRDLPSGATILESQVGGAVTPGEPVKVVLHGHMLAVETSGRAVSCSGGRTCAVLSSGKRVEGRLEGGTLVVEAP